MNLFINIYTDKDENRNNELIECLRLNKINNPSFRIYELSGRPTFKDFFNYINSVTLPTDINIIINSDIYLPEGFNVNLKQDECYALSRWDIQEDGSILHYNNSSSQDTWIFRGAIRMIEGANFTQGIPGCDNRIAHLLKEAGYKVINPSLSIKTYHLHLSNIRTYDKDRHGRKIPNHLLKRIPKPRLNVHATEL